MTRHRRLQHTMRSPARQARRAKKLRRQAKYGAEGRPALYRVHRLPPPWLTDLYGGAYARKHRTATAPIDHARAAAAALTEYTAGGVVRRRGVRTGRQGGDSRRTSR